MPFALKPSLLVLVLLLAACRSDPVNYHTLTPARTSAGPNIGNAEIKIEQINVPPQVDRSQVVIRQGNSGLVILETDWWGASLSDELHSALVDQLGGGTGPRKLGLRVDVVRFDSLPGKYALIEARWRLREASGASIDCRSQLQTPSGPTLEDLAAAQQQNVQHLAQQVAQVVNNPQRGCPN
ncbi:PqiC family protein [Pseudomonas fontis]|uniref:PqiC family protein n=1 Tax=Pseudomonas fontis TaxID=2942633 RepID=A0ABT5NPJ7_9PSED|nr:PqiC family protein [Pseudomonas fontis]MDD0973767.1 PqiC family protein [Pseudomonas fontis]MDD0990069.1 PqiC family protein [Pseudomonas fontis]